MAQLWWRRSRYFAAEVTFGILGELLCLWECFEVVLVLKKMVFGRATLSVSDAVKDTRVQQDSKPTRAYPYFPHADVPAPGKASCWDESDLSVPTLLVSCLES